MLSKCVNFAKAPGEKQMMGFGFIGLFAMLIFWGLVIAGAIWLMRSIFPRAGLSNDRGKNESENAREIIDQRYARGEITRERYLRMIEDLKDVVKE
jgi:putative membrane protein